LEVGRMNGWRVGCADGATKGCLVGVEVGR
jgi:hypothetical protein